ncbi:MAG: hypothetical protein ACXWLM_03690 [Myxococcales bacterium]
MQLGSRRRWFLGGSLGMAAAVIAVLFTFGVPQAQGGCGGATPDDELSNEDNEVWNAANNPAIFSSALEYHLDKLAAKGEAKSIPWTGSYWPTAYDNINYRWDGANSDSPAMKYQKAFGGTNVEDLVSKYHGIDSMTSSAACTTNSQCSKSDGEICAKRTGKTSGRCIPTWFGICHGWTPAAILFPEPRHPVVKNGVTFKINDLKALASLAHDKTSTKFISLRCDATNRANGMNFDKYGRPTDDACRDTNAGSFHLLIANFLGKGKAFAEDRTLDSEVWNQPLRGYRVLEKREVSAQEANKLIGVKADPGPVIKKTGTVTQGQWGHQDPVDVSAGQAFKVVMSGSGDADLYVQFDAQADALKYFCRPFKKTSGETCSGVVPAGKSKLFVSVLGKAATSTFTLQVSTGAQISTTYQFNRAAAKLVYLKVDVDYISEESPEDDGYMTPHIDNYTQTDHYEYILELDAQGRVTGGEWVGESKEVHPDFLWLPIKASAPSVAGGAIKYADVKALMEASVK